jgi:hypothetical protein
MGRRGNHAADFNRTSCELNRPALGGLVTGLMKGLTWVTRLTKHSFNE